MAVALPAIMAVTAIAGVGMTAMSAIGQSNSQNAQAEAARAQAEAARMNGQAQASMYMYNAQAGKDAADRASYEQGIKDKRLLSSQVADYSKSGVVFGEGSPLEVAADTASNQAFDQLGLKYQGDLAMWKGRVGASNAIAGGNAQANLLDNGADQMNSAASTTLLTGFGRAVGQAGSYAASSYYSSNNGRFRVPYQG